MTQLFFCSRPRARPRLHVGGQPAPGERVSARAAWFGWPQRSSGAASRQLRGGSRASGRERRGSAAATRRDVATLIARQGVRVRFADAVTRYQSGGSDRRAVAASGESCRMSSGQSTLRVRELLTAEVAQHPLSFRPFPLAERCWCRTPVRRPVLPFIESKQAPVGTSFSVPFQLATVLY